jgi:hypothetical protein
VEREKMSKYIESLLVERAGYARRGKKDRVKQVDDALAELGYVHKYAEKYSETESASIEPEAERAVTPRVTKRKG